MVSMHAMIFKSQRVLDDASQEHTIYRPHQVEDLLVNQEPYFELPPTSEY